MLFRYDFGKKPDLSKFRKQAEHYIGSMRQLSYDLYLPDFHIRIDITTPDDSNAHICTINVIDIFRDKGEIIREQVVIPMSDVRFNEIELIKQMFPVDHYTATFTSNSVQDTVDKVCRLVKLVSKINGLLAFV
jgi:hypothetical protein